MKDAYEVADKIGQYLHPSSIFLFGSVARTGHGNDLDLRPVLKPFNARFGIDPFIASEHIV